MIDSKHINKLALVLVILSLILSLFLVSLAGVGAQETKVMAYESKLFGEDIVSLDIQVDEEDWQSLLDDPTAKDYIPADLTINGEVFTTVGMRTKGNSSLTQVASMEDSDRYSLHFKFNRYQKGRTYYGLDSFCINNLLGDNTCMKDYLAYDLMDYLGVPSPLKNYAKVIVNGEDYGFFLVLERYEKAFLDRVYSTSGGQLYNVKIAMGRRQDFMDQEEGLPGTPPEGMTGGPDGDFFSQEPPDFRQEGGGMPGWPGMEEGGAMPSMPDQAERPSGGRHEGSEPMNPGGMGTGRGGGDLVYTDDQIASYSSIFDNAEFKKNSDQDKQRVITALKNLNEGKNLEDSFDVDEILRYLAVHTVLVNLDSYSSSMAQNYYIYEKDGKISILPWDYGLSFGGFQSQSAQSVINFPLDTPVSGVTMESRPLINKLLEVEAYKEKYHDYVRQIVEGYFESGRFEATILALDEKIQDYVKEDGTAFITYDQYQASLPVLIQLGNLRAQSLAGQLEGNIPSTTEGQSGQPDALVSGEGIDLNLLGSFMNGNGGAMKPGGQTGRMPDRYN